MFRDLKWAAIMLATATFFSVFAWSSLIPPSQMASAVRIRVRLAEALPEVSVRGFDLEIQEGVHHELASSPDRSSEWEFRCEGSRVRAISSRGKNLDLAGPVTVFSRGGVIRFRDRPYREELRIYPLGSLCEVVNVLDIEKYLGGLVNAEFNSRWSEQAVKAQVIAARTYALYQIRNNDSGAHFDVDATIKDQVYDGYVSEDFKASRAVDQTRGIVLTAPSPSHGNQLEPIKAFYHSSCAGRTELPENVFGDHFAGFKHTVNCPYCAYSSKIGWEYELKARDLATDALRSAEAAGGYRGWPQNWRKVLKEGNLIGLRTARLDSSGHLALLYATWFYRGFRVDLPVPAVRFREWVGGAKIKSTAFQVFPEQSWGGTLSFKISGRGNGHAVGMCQLGAKYLGERGFSASNILKHYYPDAVLSKFW